MPQANAAAESQFLSWLPKFAAQLDASLNPNVKKLRKLLSPERADRVARFVWFYLHPERELKPHPGRDLHPKLDLRTLGERRTSAKRQQAESERAAKDLERAVGSTQPVSSALAAQLKLEAQRLRSRAEALAITANIKRLGLSGNHVWLVMLTEFVAQSAQQTLTASDLGALLECGLLALECEQDVSAEAVEKALERFRTNPKNSALLRNIERQVALMCA